MTASHDLTNSVCIFVMVFTFGEMMLMSAAAIVLALSVNILAESEDPVPRRHILADSSLHGSPYFTVTNHSKVNLQMDQALLQLCSKIEEGVDLWAQSRVCHLCPLVNITRIQPHENVTLIVDSRFVSEIVIKLSHLNQSCINTFQFLEHGHYMMWINPHMGNSSDDLSLTCNIYQDNDPPNAYIPIYVSIGVLVGLSVAWSFLKCMLRRGWFSRLICMDPSDPEHLINSDLGNTGEGSQRSTSSDVDVPIRVTRLRSLDTFRGVSLIIMIFVNYGGGGYWFFKHSAWNGLTVADLVFPWFVFIMGTSMALSFRSALRRGQPRLKLVVKVLRRTVILFILGLLVSNKAKHGREVTLETLRIPGVLQRLALTYMVVGLVEALFTNTHDVHQHKWWAPVRDIVPYSVEWLLMALVVTLHCGLLFLLPVPGCPVGYLGPGGLHDDASYENCTGGVTGYVDRLLLGEAHIYQHPTCKIPYQTTQAFDPEGILGILTSAIICFLGLQAGKIIITYQDWVERSKRWLIWGVVIGCVAGGLCHFQQEGGLIPMNKNLWSLSFVLALSSMAFILLVVCYLLVDVYHIWSGAPFFCIGMNSILIYMGHEVLHDFFPIQFHVRNTHAAQLAMNVWGTAIWVIVASVLYSKKIFLAI